MGLGASATHPRLYTSTIARRSTPAPSRAEIQGYPTDYLRLSPGRGGRRSRSSPQDRSISTATISVAVLLIHPSSAVRQTGAAPTASSRRDRRPGGSRCTRARRRPRRAGTSGRSRRAARRSRRARIRSAIIAWTRGYSLSSAPPRKTPRSALFFAHRSLASTLEPARPATPNADERPAVGERADAVDQVLAADRVEDHVSAAPVGQLARPLDEVLAGVVDPVVETELLQAFELLVARRGRDHGRAGLLGELDRGHPDASGSGVDQGRLPGLRGCRR